MTGELRLFGLDASKDYATKVAEHLDMELCKHIEDYFADREAYIRSDINVRECDVFVIQSLYNDTTETLADKLVKLLFFVGSLKDASASRITVVAPYLAYQRQDRKTESRAPITTKYFAKLLEAAGADRLLTMDVHNLSAFQNAFRIQTDHLEAKNLLADFIADLAQQDKVVDNLVVLSPDSGGMGRAKRFRNALNKRLNAEVGLAYLDKSHHGKVIQGHEIVGDVANKHVVMLDDMISSGATNSESNKAVIAKNGKLWYTCATHGLFVGRVSENLSTIDNIIVTDTIKLKWAGENANKVRFISTAKIFAQAIRRIHQGGSLSELLTDGPR